MICYGAIGVGDTKMKLHRAAVAKLFETQRPGPGRRGGLRPGRGAVMPVRVAGCDPGTSSLDVVVLEDGRVADQARFSPEQLRADPGCAVRWLAERGPLDLVAGPSGYGLPLVRGGDCTDEQRRADDAGPPGRSSTAQRRGRLLAPWSRRSVDSSLPVVFLPGVIHLPTVPRASQDQPHRPGHGRQGLRRGAGAGGAAGRHVLPGRAGLGVHRLRGGLGRTDRRWPGRHVGADGLASGGAWDGEVAYLLSPLSKRDLFPAASAIWQIGRREKSLFARAWSRRWRPCAR